MVTETGQRGILEELPSTAEDSTAATPMTATSLTKKMLQFAEDSIVSGTGVKGILEELPSSETGQQPTIEDLVKYVDTCRHFTLRMVAFICKFLLPT